MTGMQIFLAIIVGLPLLLVVWAIAIYNGLITLRNRAENAWSQIDVQLKRRHDLIPNLVDVVKGAAAHEKETLERVIAARNKASTSHGVAAQGQAEAQLGRALANVVALAEQYPEIKANQNFLALQEELASTENKIGFARQHYNDAVMVFNVKREVFPSNLVAGAFNFKAKELFELEDAAERAVPKVAF